VDTAAQRESFLEGGYTVAQKESLFEGWIKQHRVSHYLYYYYYYLEGGYCTTEGVIIWRVDIQ
jgi:hypothetical protein